MTTEDAEEDLIVTTLLRDCNSFSEIVCQASASQTDLASNAIPTSYTKAGEGSEGNARKGSNVTGDKNSKYIHRAHRNDTPHDTVAPAASLLPEPEEIPKGVPDSMEPGAKSPDLPHDLNIDVEPELISSEATKLIEEIWASLQENLLEPVVSPTKRTKSVTFEDGFHPERKCTGPPCRGRQISTNSVLQVLVHQEAHRRAVALYQELVAKEAKEKNADKRENIHSQVLKAEEIAKGVSEAMLRIQAQQQ